MEKKVLFEDLFGSRIRGNILKTLALNEELTISELIRKTRLNHSIVMKHLKILQMIDFVQEKKFGRTKIYRYRIENTKAKKLKDFIEIFVVDF